jgi:outer membrane protein assembly factor BamD (BamD/ComL family)
LQKFPNDFTGQTMLAEIQAENLNDVQAAEITIHRLCEQKQSSANVAFALSMLADWQLKYAQDADAAKRALEKIIELLPNTEFERTAANRIAHLASPEALARSHEPERIILKRGVEYLGLMKDQSRLLPKEKPMGEEAAELVAHLDAHPLDHEARERLAVIYAQNYGRLDLATEQLEQLIALPGESPKHVARWLNLLADLQIQSTNDTQLAEQTLRRIIELFPKQSFGQMAENRIASLGLELKRYEHSRVVKFTPSDPA